MISYDIVNIDIKLVSKFVEEYLRLVVFMSDYWVLPSPLTFDGIPRKLESCSILYLLWSKSRRRSFPATWTSYTKDHANQPRDTSITTTAMWFTNDRTHSRSRCNPQSVRIRLSLFLKKRPSQRVTTNRSLPVPPLSVELLQPLVELDYCTLRHIDTPPTHEFVFKQRYIAQYGSIHLYIILPISSKGNIIL